MKNIGVFCSDNKVFCVERIGNKIGKMFFVEGADETAMRRQEPASITVTSEVMAQFFQQFQKQNFRTNQIHLALPSRDIIFRSFIIQWMPAHEIKTVVDYEIDKYLPFDKSELKYTFHDIKFVQDNTRKIRIVFIGIKKLSLSQYIERFKQLGLEVKIVEPGDVSLIQSLASFGEIPANETTTLVKKYKDRGKLMIIDQGVPLFVREFSLAGVESDPLLITSRLVNEVRISLDYFARQDQQFSCKKILFMSSMPEPAISTALQETLSLPVKTIELSRLFADQQVDHIEYLNAYGIGLKSSFGLHLDFNAIPDEEEVEAPLDPEEEKKRDTIATGIIIFLSLTLIVTGFMLPSLMTKADMASLRDIESQMADVQNKSVADLELERNLLKEKMQRFQGTRIKSEVGYFLKHIPEIMPEGVWLKDFELVYRNPGSASDPESLKPEITLMGYSYAGDAKTQLKKINDFLNDLRKHEKFAGYFQAIDLNSMNTEEVDIFKVTNFKITCH